MGKRVLFCVAVMIAAAGCVREVPQTPMENGEKTVETERHLYRQTVVKFTEEMAAMVEGANGGRIRTKSAGLNDFIDTYGVASITRVFSDDPRYIERQHREGLHLWYYVTYDESKLSMTKAARDFSNIPGVEIASVSHRKRPMAAVNDSYYSRQWHLHQSTGVDINVEDVWKNYTTGDPKVIVAVVDEGVALEHPDLKGNSLQGGAGKSRNFVRDNYTIRGGEHGSHVAGIISATRNNGLGVSGIAGGDAAAGKKGVTIMSCQIFDTDDNGDPLSKTDSKGNEINIAPDAIRWGADNGAVISQNSWGYYFDTNDDGYITGAELTEASQTHIDPEEKAAVDYFVKYAGCDNSGNQLPDSPMKGGIVIFAAGNDNIQYGPPADYDKVLAVGATEKDGRRAYFSTYGDWVDICAPGTDIYSTVIGNSYALMDGTSMACPMVSGVAALVLSYWGGPGFTNDMLWKCLVEGATDKYMSKNGKKNIGPFVDALGAMEYFSSSVPDAITSFSATAVGNSIKASFKVPADGSNEGAAYSAFIFASKSRTSIENLTPLSPASDILSASVATRSLAVGSDAEITLSVPEFNTKYYYTVISRNGGSFSDASAIKEITTSVNNPPVITCNAGEGVLSVKASEKKSVIFTITDPDGHNVTASLKAGSKAEKWTNTGSGKYELLIDGSLVPQGTYKSEITAKDPYGLSASYVLQYTVSTNTAPVAAKPIGNLLAYLSDNEDIVIVLSEAFTDADSDPLVFSAMVSGSPAVTANIVNGSLIVKPVSAGTSEIRVEAADPLGKRAYQIVKVAVRSYSSEAVVVYPTQVKDKITVGTGAETEDVLISVYSGSGAKVHSSESFGSAFEPAEFNLSHLAPGRYTLKVAYGNVTASKTIIKL